MTVDHPNEAGSEPPSNPVLVEVHRGNGLESRHRGAVAVADSGGDIVARVDLFDSRLLVDDRIRTGPYRFELLGF